MKILLILAPIVVGLVAAVATMAAIGSLLPKGHRATRSVHLSVPPDAAWFVITDFPSHPSWRPGLRSTERQPDQNGRAMWLERTREHAMLLEVAESDPPRRLVTRIASRLPFGGSWTYDLTPERNGTRLRITEDGEVYNPIFRYMSRFMNPAGTIEQYMRALGAKLNTPITIDPT